MAKANLPVNFKDDILKENMNGKRRFNMIQNSDGTVSFEDVTDYTQVGSTFGAAQINATNEAVNNAADANKIIDNLETIKANTQSGYIAGALAVKELSSNLGGLVFEFSINYNSTINMRRKIHEKKSSNKLVDDFLMNTTYETPYYRINQYSSPNATLTTLVDMKDANGNVVPANTTYTWTYSNGSFPSTVVTLVTIS